MREPSTTFFICLWIAIGALWIGADLHSIKLAIDRNTAAIQQQHKGAPL